MKVPQARSSGRSGDRGQAVVELALAMPLLCLLLLGIVQVALVVRDQLLVIEAARIGARAAAVSAQPAESAADAVSHAINADASVSTAISHGYVTVTVARTSHTDVALVGWLLPDVDVRSSATMMLEPP